MIKINLIAVGKVKEDYFKKGIDEYLKRLSRFAEVTLTEIKEENLLPGTTLDERQKIMALEGENILKKLKGKTVAMCIEGEKITSEGFAALIKSAVDSGEELTFVIGGSYGIDKRVKDVAAKKLSFSPMTFPHTMFRLMFCEQLYRAFSIINNSSYHK
ncbi:MAG: 23S rRNA (pseudouridine(1915)-N(3))-methyltransferase RlmH [Clostridia bacterium]|nr:23S rRNA (pseudouridine(1915)-N(3))-methyltransferase RlmH [Clostridia bacterium]